MQHHSPLGSSDHKCLSFELKCYTEQYKQNDDFCKYNYKKADYTAINSELNEMHWDTLCDKSIDINWNLFKSNVLAISSKYIPEVTKKRVSNKPPWWSILISEAIKDKQYWYSQYKFTRSDIDYASYVLKRNQVKFLIKFAKARYDKLLIQTLTSNPKTLYGYI